MNILLTEKNNTCLRVKCNHRNKFTTKPLLGYVHTQPMSDKRRTTSPLVIYFLVVFTLKRQLQIFKASQHNKMAAWLKKSLSTEKGLRVQCHLLMLMVARHLSGNISLGQIFLNNGTVILLSTKLKSLGGVGDLHNHQGLGCYINLRIEKNAKYFLRCIWR